MPFNDDYEPDILIKGIDENPEHWGQIADYSGALSSPKRVKYLTGLIRGQTQVEIADELDIASAPLSVGHRDKLKDGELVYEPSEVGMAVAVTPLGHYTIEDRESNLRDVLTAFQMLQKAEQEYPSESNKVEKDIHTWKWENSWEEIQKHLGVTDLSYQPEK